MVCKQSETGRSSRFNSQSAEVMEEGALVRVNEDNLDEQGEDLITNSQGSQVAVVDNNAVLSGDSEAESVFAEELGQLPFKCVQGHPKGQTQSKLMIALKDLDKYIWANADLISKALFATEDG